MAAVLTMTLAQAPAPTGSIQGVVEQVSTKTGIAEVQIVVTAQAPPPSATQARGAFGGGTQTVATLQTDATGHFEMKNLAPGNYTIQATREGYLAGGLDQLSVNALAIAVATVTADQVSNVTISMTRGSTLSGRITDTNGNPATKINVAAFQFAYQQDGRALLREVLARQTDDHGEYRLFWLSPGDYYIGIRIPVRGAASAVTSIAHPLFLPGVVDANAATRITVTEGADLTGLSFSLKPVPPGVSVSGKVANSLPNVTGPRGGGPPDPSARQFYLLPLDPNALTEGSPTGIQNRSGGARGGGNTDFQIFGVLPGAYDLIGLVNDDQGRLFPGRTRIDVGNQDLTGVIIPVHPGVEVKGHFTVRGDGPADISSFRLQPADGTPSFALSILNGPGGRGGRGNNVSQGTTASGPALFSYSNVPDGRYAFQVRLLKENSYVEDIREGSRSIYDSGLTIENGKAPGEIEVFINPSGETVEGTVFDATQKPAVGRVVLVPAPSRRQNGNLYKFVITEEAGKFSLPGIAPGDYKLFAWEDVPVFAWQNAEFMARYEEFGTSVRVAPGVRNDLQIRVIPAGK